MQGGACFVLIFRAGESRCLNMPSVLVFKVGSALTIAY